MLTHLQLPGIIPAGAGMELVDDDDPILMRCSLVIEGSLGETRDAEPAWPKHQPTGLGRAGSCPWASPLHGPRPRGGGLTSWILRKSPHGAPWRGQIRRFYVRKTLGAVSRGTGLFGAILAGDDIKGVVGSQRGQTLCFTRSYNHPARRSCGNPRAKRDNVSGGVSKLRPLSPQDRSPRRRRERFERQSPDV